MARVAFAFIQPDAMAAPAPLHAFNEGVGLHGCGRHSRHGYPSHRMFTCGELLELFRMADRAVTRGNGAADALVFTDSGRIEDAWRRFFDGKMAVGTSHPHFEMLAQLPVANGAARNAFLHMTLHAGGAFLRNFIETQLTGNWRSRPHRPSGQRRGIPP